MKKSLLALSVLSLFLVNPIAQAVEEEDKQTGTYFEIDDETGELIRIRTEGEAELEFGDRKDIRIATQKATLRAKANLAKFLNERVTAADVLDSMVNTMTTTTGQSQEAVRETVENYAENIRNSAESILKGVITLKTDVNKDEKYVLVEVGMSRKTMKAADSANKVLRTDSTETQSSKSKGTSQAIDVGTGREIRKSKNYDDF